MCSLSYHLLYAPSVPYITTPPPPTYHTPTHSTTCSLPHHTYPENLFFTPVPLSLLLTHTHTQISPPSYVHHGSWCGFGSDDDVCISFAMSQAWQLGRAVLRAQHTHTNVLDAITEQQKGIILLTGKVSRCRGGSIPFYHARERCAIK